jgi:hypothetical protein
METSKRSLEALVGFNQLRTLIARHGESAR